MLTRFAPWIPAALMGLATIGSYGVAYYAIGVLIPAISADTGWGVGGVAAGFSIGAVGAGGVALLAGRTFDRRGSRPILAPALAVGAAAFLLASLAREPWQFSAAWAVGGAAVAGGLFYNVTMPVVSRLYPERRAAALSVLTLLGALASPIFYPLAGVMIEEWGWRGAIRGLVVVMVLCVAPSALLVRAPAASTPRDEGARSGGVVEAVRTPSVHRALLVFALAGLASSALLIHQVAAMQAAGLTLAAASGFAGARGAAQIPGRLLMAPLVRMAGVRGAIAICYGLAMTATLALLAAHGGVPLGAAAAYYAVVCGMSLGMLSPLNGMFQADVYGDARPGTLTGVSTVIGSIASAGGAWGAGVGADATGSYAAPLAIVVLLHGLAVVALAWQARAPRGARVAVQG